MAPSKIFPRPRGHFLHRKNFVLGCSEKNFIRRRSAPFGAPYIFLGGWRFGAIQRRSAPFGVRTGGTPCIHADNAHVVGFYYVILGFRAQVDTSDAVTSHKGKKHLGPPKFSLKVFFGEKKCIHSQELSDIHTERSWQWGIKSLGVQQ